MKKLILLLTLILCVNAVSKAQNFSAINSDGDTIYYKILSPNTVSVTYKGTNPSMYKEYSDTINVPSHVLDSNNTLYKVTTIGYQAFNYNDSVKHITLPNTIEKIEDFAFARCAINQITLPHSVDTLAHSIFAWSKIKHIEILTKNAPNIESNTFFTVPDTIDIHVVCGDSLIYKNTPNWSRFTNITTDLQIINEINTSVCQGTIYNQNGFNDSIAGTYVRTSQTPDGCDSVTILNLSINPTYNIIFDDTICGNHYYNSHGFNVNTTGIYTQNLQTLNGCDSIITLHLIVKPIHNTAIYDTICYGNNYTSNGFNVNVGGVHLLVLSSVEGCDSTILLRLFVKNPINAQLCLVNVDNNNHNELVWVKNELVDHYIIYRETTISDEYEQIANVSYNNITKYTDTTSNPNMKAYRYKISSIDTCGNESILSDFHKTVHLTISQGANDSTWNLNWTAYEGVNYQTYYIYRRIGNGQLELIDSIASNYSSWTDLNAPSGSIYYQIEILTNGCNPTKSSYSSIRSNLVSNKNVGLSHINNNIIVNIYPNPAKNKTLILTENISGKTNVILYDLFGRNIKEINSNKNIIELDLSNISEGTYIVKISNNNKYITKKLIVK